MDNTEDYQLFASSNLCYILHYLLPKSTPIHQYMGERLLAAVTQLDPKSTTKLDNRLLNVAKRQLRNY